METHKTRVNRSQGRFVLSGLVLILVLGLYIAMSPVIKSEPGLFNRDFFSEIINNFIGQASKEPQSSTNSDPFTEEDDPEPYLYALNPTQTLYIKEYPNKSIQVPAGKIKEITIYNIIGTKIITRAYIDNHPQISVPGQGVFFLTITYKDQNTFTKKLVNLN